jgi:PAS domain S-box-containing protein
MISVLYVDDEPALLELFRIYLEEEHEFSVRTAPSGPAALALLEKTPVDVVVSDYQMPVMDGIELLKQCRQRHGDLPFILFTGRGREEIVIEAIDNGADFYLQKGGEPMAQFAELLHKCRQAVRRRRAEAGLRESERRYREMAERISDVVMIMDEHGIPTYVSPSMETVTGYRPEELVGRPMDPATIDPASLARIRETEGANRSGRTSEPIVVQGRRRDGTAVALEGRGVPIIQDGQFRGAQVVLRDVTERNRARDQLLEAAAFSRQIIADVQEGILVCDLERRFATWNPFMEHLTGLSATEVLGRRMLEVFPFFAEAGINDLFERAYTGETVTVPDYPYAVPGSDTTRYATSVFMPLLNATGDEVIGVIGVYQDITERRLAEDEIRAANEQLTAAEEELRQSMEELKASEEAARSSEEQVRRVLEGSPTGVHLYELRDDGALVFLGGNTSADRILGISHEDYVGLTIDEAFPGLDRTGVPDRYREVARTGRPWHTQQVEYEGREVSGAYEVWAFRIQPGRIAVEFMDITSRLALEARLLRLGREWEGIFQAVGQPILILGPDQRILAANRAAQRSTGLAIGELEGRFCFEVFHGASAPPDGCPFRRYMDCGDAYGTVEMAIEALEGTYLVSCTPLLDADGQLEKMIHIATEITDRVRDEQALRSILDRHTLLSRVTRHDLRNRMTALEGYLQLTERDRDPAHVECYRRRIREILRAMDRVLAFASDYDRVGVVAPQWQGIAGVARAAAEEVGLDGIRLDLEIGSHELFADPMLRKVFSNLMENTVRYGETATRIGLSVATEGDELVLRYEDDGVGIPEADKRRIFERGVGANTGLGLYLVDLVLSITGIEIRETGRPGSGAVFELRCPAGTWR